MASAASEAQQKAAQAHRKRCEALLEIGRAAQAEREARAALAIDPRDAEAHLLLCRALLSQERRAEAEAQAHEAIGLDPRDAYAHYLLGFARQTDGRHRDAIEPLRAAVSLAPRVGRYRSRLALALLEEGTQRDAARVEIEEAVALGPENPYLLDEAARVFTSLDEFERGEAHARAAVAKRPDAADAHWRLAWVLGRRKRYADAADAARRALAIDPNHWCSWDELGYALFQLQSYEACERACIEALRLRPTLRASAWNLATVYLNRGWFRRAERVCEQTLMRDAGCDSVRAVAARAAARREEARSRRANARVAVGAVASIVLLIVGAIAEAEAWALFSWLVVMVALVAGSVQHERRVRAREEGHDPPALAGPP